jgi:hypothetical protein
MTTSSPKNLVSPGSDGVNQERTLTMRERLAQRERSFLEGPENLSERSTRKRIAYDSASERHQARED